MTPAKRSSSRRLNETESKGVDPSLQFGASVPRRTVPVVTTGRQAVVLTRLREREVEVDLPAGGQ